MFLCHISNFYSIMKKILYFTLLLSSFLLVNAQNNQPQEMSTQQISGSPTSVQIHNATSTQNDHTFTISFDILNKRGVQPDIHYGVALVRNIDNRQEILDEKVYEDVLTLRENEKLHKVVSYIAPENFSGDFSLRIISKTSRAVPLAFDTINMLLLESQIMDILK